VHEIAVGDSSHESYKHEGVYEFTLKRELRVQCFCNNKERVENQVEYCKIYTAHDYITQNLVLIEKTGCGVVDPFYWKRHGRLI
jgi:hypothetical protein